MKHYFHPMSRGASTDWMLKELDVEHEQIVIDLASGENLSAEFRRINPMAKIPVLVDGDVVITETAAICAYLADKFPAKGLAPPSISQARGKYYRYLFFPGTTLEPMFSFSQLEVENQNSASTGWGDLERCLAAIEELTPARDWVLGEQFSAADIVYGGSLDVFMLMGLLEAPSQIVQDYVGRLRDRPAYKLSHGAM